jgi:hypothetical protein
MRATIAGMEWDVPSPSYFRLAQHQLEQGAIIDLSYLGDRWCLFLYRKGHVTTTYHKRRDDALAMVVKAFQRRRRQQ